MYVIMLDYLKKQFPDDWPISGKNDDRVKLRQQKTHDGSPELMSKEGRTMTEIEPKTLTNVRTGSTDAGAIYRVG